MLKKIVSILLVLTMIFAFAGCGEQKQEDKDVFKVGMICIGDDNAAYDRNFYLAANMATEMLEKHHIKVQWIYKYNVKDGDDSTNAASDLAEMGCKLVFANSYGMEDGVLAAAAECPDTQFVCLTNEGSAFDDLTNTHNAFVRIYEGRYLAGVAAGMKLNELGQTKLGYVAAYDYAEVISGYTAFYLGAKSVCPEVTMDVLVVGSWSDAGQEAQAANVLYGRGCYVISQHSDNTTPATTADEHDIFHTGYNISMSDVAPDASIISTRIDWTNYFVHAIETVYNGEELEQDFCSGLSEGDVIMTELNEKIAAPGTAEALEEAKIKIINGQIKVFDTNTFTVNGEKVEHCFAIDTDGDWVADKEEAIVDGAFIESYFKSAPYFALHIDGITLAN